MKVLRKYFTSFAGLIFPDLCLACRHEHPISQGIFCVRCEAEMPYCGFENLEQNDASSRISGRLNTLFVTSYLYFKSDNIVQNILHALKYEGKEEVGLSLGELHGNYLKQFVHHMPDLIVPVPLHPKKLHSRGYNQSEIYARGLASSLGIPMSANILSRKKYTETQTKMNKIERLQNVDEAFTLSKPEKIRGKHVLLVDDVLTTGATLEACGLALQKVPDLRLSIATLALADNW